MNAHIETYKHYLWSLMTDQEREWVKSYGGFRFIGQIIEIGGRMKEVELK